MFRDIHSHNNDRRRLHYTLKNAALGCKYANDVSAIIHDMCQKLSDQSCEPSSKFNMLFHPTKMENHENSFEALQWRYNGHNGVSNHQPHHSLLNRLFRHGSKKRSKLRVMGLFADDIMIRGLSMMTSSNGNIFRVTGHLCGEFTGPRWIPHTKASDAELWCLLWSVPE